MTKIRVHMTDSFSGAKLVKDYTPTPEQLRCIQQAYNNKQVIRQYDNSINWAWVIDKIENL